MKKMFFFLSIILFASVANAQKDNPKYDATLAKSLGGDDYGMKQYVLAILKSGTNKTADKKTTDSLFRGHMDNINRLASSGKLVVAGPLQKNDKEYRGIFILDARSIEEAKAMVNTDPAVIGKLLDFDLFVWYGSAALPTYLPNHEKIEKKSF